MPFCLRLSLCTNILKFYIGYCPECYGAVSFFFFFTMAQQPPSGLRPPRYRGFTITLRHTTHGRTPLDERSARRRDLYLITHNTHKRHTCIPLARFEPTIPKSERPQTHALDQAARGIGFTFGCMNKNE